MVDFTIRIKAAVLSRYPRVHKHLIPRPLRGFWMIRARPPKLWTSCEQKVLQVHQPLRFDKKTSTKQRGPPLKTMKCEFHKCLTRLKWKYVRNCLALWIMIEVVAVSRIANSRGVLRGCLWVFYDGIPQEPPTGAQECLQTVLCNSAFGLNLRPFVTPVIPQEAMNSLLLSWMLEGRWEGIHHFFVLNIRHAELSFALTEKNRWATAERQRSCWLWNCTAAAHQKIVR